MQLAKHLNGQRYRLSVVCPEEGELIGRLGEMGIRTEMVRLSPLINPVALLRLVRTLGGLRPDLIQSHGARSNFYAAVAGRLVGTRVVLLTVHNSLYDYPVSGNRRNIYLTFNRISCRLADKILCVADSLAGDLTERSGVDREKITIIHNGVDLERFSPARISGVPIRQELSLEGTPVIAIIGRMTEQKGHTFFLRALGLLRNSFPGIRGFIVGDGPLREELERQACLLGVRESCAFLGVRQDIPEILAAVNVVTVPSLSEGFPYVVLEAMAMARPVVASRVSGLPEVIEDGVNGMLVPPRDPAALATAIKFLLTNPSEARRMGQQARALVQERFSLERMVKATQDLYAALLTHGV